MQIISYDGYTFATDQIHGGLPWDSARGQFHLLTTVQPVQSGRPRLTGGQLTERRIPVEFVLESTTVDVRDGANLLLGRLQPDNPTPRELVMQWNDGTQYTTLATVELTQPLDTLVNVVPVTFVSAEPIWRKTTTELASTTFTVDSGAAFTLPVSNAGQATAHPVITFAPTTKDATDWALFVRRTLPIANTGDRTWKRQPIRVDLGDMTAWSIFNPFLPEEEFYVFLDGIEQPRSVVNFGTLTGSGKHAYLWLVVDELAPGETLTYDLCYGNGLPELPLELHRQTAPAFDIRAAWGTADGGSTTTLLVTGAGWATNQWAGGVVEFLSGADVGEVRTIDSNTNAGIVFSPAISAAPTDDEFVITMSSNEKWIYPVQQEEDSRAQRGLWWINRGQNRPSVTRFDIPGAWEPYLFLDNNDEKSQSEWVEINVGTQDFFAILNAIRIWDQAVDLGRNEGNADGVTFDSAWPITHWTFDSLFKNPVPMAKGFFGTRESGAGDWERVLERTGEFDDFTADSVVRRTLPTDVPQHHLVAALLPVDESEIPVSWGRDAGISTGGGSSTLQDTNKSWTPGQWIGATVRIISDVEAPAAAGQQRTCVGNSATSVSISPDWTTTPGSNAEYEIIAKRVASRLRSNTTWEVEFDTADVDIGPLSAEMDNFRTVMTIRLDGGTLATPAPPYDQLRIGLDDRSLFLSSAEEVRVDCATRRAGIHDRTTGAKLRDISGVVTAEHVTATGTRLATDWLPLSPGAHDLHVTVPVNGSGGDFSAEHTEGRFAS